MPECSKGRKEAKHFEELHRTAKAYIALLHNKATKQIAKLKD